MRQTFSDELLFGIVQHVQENVGSTDEMLLLTEVWSWLGTDATHLQHHVQHPYLANLKGEMKKPITFGPADIAEGALEAYQHHYDYVCLFDGALNLAGNLTTEICNEVAVLWFAVPNVRSVSRYRITPDPFCSECPSR